MRLGAAAEFVSLDQALEAFSLRMRGDVHDLTCAEDLGFELLAGFEALVATNLDNMAMRLEARPLGFAKLALAELALYEDAKRDARGGGAVFLGGSQAEHPARAGFEHSHRGGRAVSVEQLGHAQLLGE